jgi:hypothetical protein
MNRLHVAASLVVSVALISVIAACSGGSSGASGSPTPTATPSGTATPTGTATPGPYTCLGVALPTTATDPVSIAGIASAAGLSGTTPVSGAAINVYRTGNATSLGNATTIASGAFTISVATGGTPLDGYLKGTAATYLDTYLYTDAPIAKNLAAAPVFFLTQSTFNLLAGAAGVTQTAGKGWIGVEVLDCTGTPVAGATVTSNPAGTVKYLAGTAPSSSATMTDVSGQAFIFNAGPGTVTISATAAGHTLRSHDVNVIANVITTAAIAPGPL